MELGQTLQAHHSGGSLVREDSRVYARIDHVDFLHDFAVLNYCSGVVTISPDVHQINLANRTLDLLFEYVVLQAATDFEECVELLTLSLNVGDHFVRTDLTGDVIDFSGQESKRNCSEVVHGDVAILFRCLEATPSDHGPSFFPVAGLTLLFRRFSDDIPSIEGKFTSSKLARAL